MYSSVKILKGFDDDVITNLSKQMKEKGIKFITGMFPRDVLKKISSFMLILNLKKIEKFDLVMEALGRDPNVEKFKFKLCSS